MTIKLEFMPTLQKIADDPRTIADQFPPVIPSHRNDYSLNRIKTIVAIAAAALSFVVFRYSKAGSIALVAFAALIFYSAIQSKSVETDAYKQQKKEIRALFDPSGEGLREAYYAKGNAIYNAVHETPATSIEEVKTAVELVVNIYDRKAQPSEWTGKPIKANPLDEGLNETLKKNAEKLLTYEMEDISKNQVLIGEFKWLQSVAKKFLNGRQPDFFNGRNAHYVAYGWDGVTASVLNDFI